MFENIVNSQKNKKSSNQPSNTLNVQPKGFNHTKSIHTVVELFNTKNDSDIIMPLKRQQQEQADGLVKEVRLAVIGNTNAGKSSLVGVLTKGVLDSGEGLARQEIFEEGKEEERKQLEAATRSTTLGFEVMGFDENLDQLLPLNIENKYEQSAIITEYSHKMICLLDMCGHEIYLKTTLYGMSSQFPDYSMIVIGAKTGISPLTKEHIGISLAY